MVWHVRWPQGRVVKADGRAGRPAHLLAGAHKQACCCCCSISSCTHGMTAQHANAQHRPPHLQLRGGESIQRFSQRLVLRRQHQRGSMVGEQQGRQGVG